MTTIIRKQITDLRMSLLRLRSIGADTKHVMQSIENLTNQLLFINN